MKNVITQVSTQIDSPVGVLTLVASLKGLCAVLWPNDDPQRVPLRDVRADDDDLLVIETHRQLDEYFAGSRRKFSVPLHFSGTPFQRQVWQALITIPYGETRSYSQIAQQIRAPTAVRAVGAANGRNPISILAPCHRVLGSDGKLTGFAGGLEAKRRLLALERSGSADRPRASRHCLDHAFAKSAHSKVG